MLQHEFGSRAGSDADPPSRASIRPALSLPLDFVLTSVVSLPCLPCAPRPPLHSQAAACRSALPADGPPSRGTLRFAPPHHHGSAALPTTPAKRLYAPAFFHSYFYMLWPKDVYCISSAGLFIYDISCYIMVIMCIPRSPELLRPRHVGVDGPLHQHIVFFQSILE